MGGNTILELVFTLVPTFALIFAFIDFGLALFRWSTLQNAVREGCRYAVTFQTQSGMGQDASIKAVVSQFSMGLVTPNDNPQHIFVAYYSPSNLTTPIASGGNTPGNVVQVSVSNITWSWLAPLSGSFTTNTTYGSTYGMSVYSSDILGGYPVGVTSVTR